MTPLEHPNFVPPARRRVRDRLAGGAEHERAGGESRRSSRERLLGGRGRRRLRAPGRRARRLRKLRASAEAEGRCCLLLGIGLALIAVEAATLAFEEVLG